MKRTWSQKSDRANEAFIHLENHIELIRQNGSYRACDVLRDLPGICHQRTVSRWLRGTGLRVIDRSRADIWHSGAGPNVQGTHSG